MTHPTFGPFLLFDHGLFLLFEQPTFGLCLVLLNRSSSSFLSSESFLSDSIYLESLFNSRRAPSRGARDHSMHLIMNPRKFVIVD